MNIRKYAIQSSKVFEAVRQKYTASIKTMTVNKEVKCGLSKSPKGSLKKNIAKLCIREVAVTKKRIILRSAVLKFPGKVRNGIRPAIAMNANRLRSDSRWWSISLIK